MCFVFSEFPCLEFEIKIFVPALSLPFISIFSFCHFMPGNYNEMRPADTNPVVGQYSNEVNDLHTYCASYITF